MRIIYIRKAALAKPGVGKSDTFQRRFEVPSNCVLLSADFKS